VSSASRTRWCSCSAVSRSASAGERDLLVGAEEPLPADLAQEAVEAIGYAGSDVVTLKG